MDLATFFTFAVDATSAFIACYMGLRLALDWKISWDIVFPYPMQLLIAVPIGLSAVIQHTSGGNAASSTRLLLMLHILATLTGPQENTFSNAVFQWEWLLNLFSSLAFVVGASHVPGITHVEAIYFVLLSSWHTTFRLLEQQNNKNRGSEQTGPLQHNRRVLSLTRFPSTAMARKVALAAHCLLKRTDAHDMTRQEVSQMIENCGKMTEVMNKKMRDSKNRAEAAEGISSRLANTDERLVESGPQPISDAIHRAQEFIIYKTLAHSSQYADSRKYANSAWGIGAELPLVGYLIVGVCLQLNQASYIMDWAMFSFYLCMIAFWFLRFLLLSYSVWLASLAFTTVGADSGGGWLQQLIQVHDKTSAVLHARYIKASDSRWNSSFIQSCAFWIFSILGAIVSSVPWTFFQVVAYCQGGAWAHGFLSYAASVCSDSFSSSFPLRHCTVQPSAAEVELLDVVYGFRNQKWPPSASQLDEVRAAISNLTYDDRLAISSHTRGATGYQLLVKDPFGEKEAGYDTHCEEFYDMVQGQVNPLEAAAMQQYRLADLAVILILVKGLEGHNDAYKQSKIQAFWADFNLIIPLVAATSAHHQQV